MLKEARVSDTNIAQQSLNYRFWDDVEISLTQPVKHFGNLCLATIPWDITCSEVQLGNFQA